MTTRPFCHLAWFLAIVLGCHSSAVSAQIGEYVGPDFSDFPADVWEGQTAPLDRTRLPMAEHGYSDYRVLDRAMVTITGHWTDPKSAEFYDAANRFYLIDARSGPGASTTGFAASHFCAGSLSVYTTDESFYTALYAVDRVSGNVVTWDRDDSALPFTTIERSHTGLRNDLDFACSPSSNLMVVNLPWEVDGLENYCADDLQSGSADCECYPGDDCQDDCRSKDDICFYSLGAETKYYVREGLKMRLLAGHEVQAFVERSSPAPACRDLSEGKVEIALSVGRLTIQEVEGVARVSITGKPHIDVAEEVMICEESVVQVDADGNLDQDYLLSIQNKWDIYSAPTQLLVADGPAGPTIKTIPQPFRVLEWEGDQKVFPLIAHAQGARYEIADGEWYETTGYDESKNHCNEMSPGSPRLAEYGERYYTGPLAPLDTSVPDGVLYDQAPYAYLADYWSNVATQFSSPTGLEAFGPGYFDPAFASEFYDWSLNGEPGFQPIDFAGRFKIFNEYDSGFFVMVDVTNGRVLTTSDVVASEIQSTAKNFHFAPFSSLLIVNPEFNIDPKTSRNQCQPPTGSDTVFLRWTGETFERL